MASRPLGPRDLLGWILLAVIVFLTGACGGGPSLSTNPGSRLASLALNPSSMSFGNVDLGSSQSQTGTLTASGSNVTVSSASLAGQGYSLNGITFPTTIAAGNSISFTVTFAPQTPGSFSGQISFFSDVFGLSSVITTSGHGIQIGPHSVSLTWTDSTSLVMGYNIYRSTQSGGPYAKLNSSLLTILAYTDSSVQSGSTYFYVSTAVDSNNVESAYSNVATAVIP